MPCDRLVKELLRDGRVEAVYIPFCEPQLGLILESVEPLEALEVGLPLSQASDRLHLLVDPGEHELGRLAKLALAGVDEAHLGVVHEPLLMILNSDHRLSLLQLEDSVGWG